MTLSSANIDKPSEFDSETLDELYLEVIGKAGLDEPTSAELFGDKANAEEILFAANYKILECKDAEEEVPPSVTFSIRYKKPTVKMKRNGPCALADAFYKVELEYDGVALYCQTVKVYLGRDQVSLDGRPHHEALLPSTSDFSHERDGSGDLVLKNDIWDNAVTDLENGVFISTYTQTRPHRFDIKNFSRLRTDWDKLAHFDIGEIHQHSNFGKLIQEETGIRKENIRISFWDCINTSGRSGSRTYRVTIFDQEDLSHGNGFSYVITVAEGNWQRKLAEHAATCQQKLHEKGIPVAKIYRPVTSYYSEATDQHYYIQEYAKGKHFDLDLRHIEKLGKAMADTHNIPVGEMPEPLTGNVLEPEGLIGEVKRVLEELGKPPEKRKIFSTDEEMVASAKGQLLGRFTWDELRKTPERQDLCKQLNLTQSDALAYKSEQKKQAKLDHGLPTGICWGDPHLKNLLADEDGNITLLDFQACGEGVLANELTLVSYFFLTGEQGQLDHGRMKAFFEPYCEGRERQAVPGPLTQEEIMAMIQKLHSLSQRQAHPIWVMMRSQGTAMYHGFSQRHAGLKDQMERYMEDGKVTHEGANRFAQEFLGAELDAFRSCNSEKTPLNTVITSRLAHGSHGGSFAARG